MPVIPLREFGRKPSKVRPKTQTELEAEQKLDQALERLQAALPLGWVGDETNDTNKHSSWFVADASVQQQASKAILGLAEALVQHYKAVEKDVHWSKMVQAAVVSVGPPLRFLLTLANPTIVQRAAHACHVAASHLDTWRDAMLPLAAPLASLLDSNDPTTLHYVASGLVLMILDKPGNRSKAKVKGFQPIKSFTAQLLFESFVEAQALERMKRQLTAQGRLEVPGHKTGGSQGRQVALDVFGLLLVAVKKSEKLHDAAAVDLEWVAVLGRSMASPDGSAVAAAMTVAAVLAADTSFGAALLRAQPSVSPVIVRQLALPGASEDAGCAPALLLLAALAPLPNSDTLLDSKPLSKSIVRILAAPPTDEPLLLETLATVGALLRRRDAAWGPALLSSGLAQGLVTLLGWPAPSDRSGEMPRDPPRQKSDIDPQTRKMCWRVVELLGCSGGLGAKGKAAAATGAFGELPKLVWSHFHSKVYFFSPGDAGSAAERVEVSRALLSFLSSPFPSLSKATRAIAMPDYGSMTEMRIGILPGDPPGYFQGARTADADSILEGGLLKAAALAALDPMRISAATGFRIVTLLALKLDSVLGHVSDDERVSDAELDGPFLDATTAGDQCPLSRAEKSPEITPLGTAQQRTAHGNCNSPTPSDALPEGDIQNDRTEVGREGECAARPVGNFVLRPPDDDVSASAGNVSGSAAGMNRSKDDVRGRVGDVSGSVPDVGGYAGDVSERPGDVRGGAGFNYGSADDVSGRADDVSEGLEHWEGKDGLLLAALQAFCGLYGRWRASVEPFASESVRTVSGVQNQQLDRGAHRAGAENGETSSSVGGNGPQLAGRGWWRVYSTGVPLTELLCREMCGSLRRQLERVCGGDEFSWGVRCWAARALSKMGVYGCPSRLGEEMGAVLGSDSDGPGSNSDGSGSVLDRSKVVFRLSDGQSLRAHKAILAARSPALLALPSESTAGRVAGRPESTAVAAGQPEPSDVSRTTPSDGVQSSPDATAPNFVQLSRRVSYKAFCALLEFVYTGWVDLGGPVKREVERELLLLAKRCQLDSLATLLEGGRPLPGDRPPQYSLADALRTSLGLAQCDVTLNVEDVRQIAARRAGDDVASRGARVLAHRVVLAARSEYFRALFRSGMRDSVSGVITLFDTSPSAVSATLYYLYTGQLVRPQNSPSSLSEIISTRIEATGNRRPSQTLPSNDSTPRTLSPPPAGAEQNLVSRFGDRSLVVYVETADLAERWMLERLPGLCLEQVRRHLTPEVATAVLHAAAARAQWAFCEAAVSKLAPRFRALLDDEGFRSLPEELQEAVRVEHVRLQQEG